tara:strand:- start:331 stop:528 length:198 start_codon:yes stop_codon:yes gene_type:complete
MGSSSSKPTRTVKFVVDGMDELDVRLDDLESKFDDMLTLISALSAQVVAIKTAKAPAKKAPAKKK